MIEIQLIQQHLMRIEGQLTACHSLIGGLLAQAMRTNREKTEQMLDAAISRLGSIDAEMDSAHSEVLLEAHRVVAQLRQQLLQAPREDDPASPD